MCRHERTNRSRRAYRAWLKKEGFCYDCGMPVKEGRTRCEKCLRKIADRQKRLTRKSTTAKTKKYNQVEYTTNEEEK
jgi:predicted amidophosphoribosyltransferase